MSALQIGLAIVGVLVLVALAAQAAWISRKNQPRQATAHERDDPSSVGSDAPVRLEPEAELAAFGGVNFSLPKLEKRAGLDALIDVIAPLALDVPLAGEVVLAALPATRRVGSKPFAIEGLNAISQAWETPLTGERYIAFQAGVQLANRLGALNEIEYSEFVIKTQAFCDSINAAPDFPEMLEAVARAHELDQFASEHDAQLGFVVRACGAAWSPSYVQQNAARLGFGSAAMAGRMVLPASSAGLAPLLTLNFDAQAALADDPAQSAVRELVLALDVPQVERSECPFKRLRGVAQALADSMDGVVTDDRGLPLVATALDVIETELEGLYDTLDQRDLSAGSALARRLFS
jgi:hypothetical protein